MNWELLYKWGRNSYGWMQKHSLRGGHALPPLSVICLLTARCNLNCEFCYLVHQGSLQKRRRDELSTEDWKAVLGQVPTRSIVTFTGGEPLIRKDFPDLLAFTAQTHLIHIISNGVLLTPDTSRLLVEFGPKGKLPLSGMAAIGVSLMGPEETHDAVVRVGSGFRRAVEGIQNLQEAKRRAGARAPLIDLKVVVTNRNYKALPEMAPLLGKLKPDFITLQIEAMIPFPWYDPEQGVSTEGPLSPLGLFRYPKEAECGAPGAVAEAMRKLAQTAENAGVKVRYYPDTPLEDFVTHFKRNSDRARGFCVSPWTDLFVGPWGDVGICLGGTVGNVRERAVTDLFNDEKFRRFRQVLRKESILPACRGCCFYQA